MGQHARIMFSNDIIHSLNQLWPLECDMRASLLKVTNAEEITFVRLSARMIADMFHQPGRDITAIIRDGFTIQQEEHPLQICQLITTPAPVQAKTSAIVGNQVVNDNLFTKTAWAV